MKPEKIINSFLVVLKTSPNLFSEAATEALKTLEKELRLPKMNQIKQFLKY